MTIETEKIRYPKYSLRRWTHATMHCFFRNCICENCIYQKAIKSQKCKGKIAVLLLIELFGTPKKKDYEFYKKIQRETDVTEIENLWWFTPATGETIGIIKTKDKITGEIKFRIGVGKGKSEFADIELIQNFGARLIPENIK